MKAWRGVLLLFILAALIVPGGCETPPEEPPYTLHADVEIRSDGMQILITNNDPFNWFDVTYRIYPAGSDEVYNRSIMIHQSGSRAFLSPYSQFHNEAGEGFDYTLHPIAKITIEAEIPRGKPGYYELIVE